MFLSSYKSRFLSLEIILSPFNIGTCNSKHKIPSSTSHFHLLQIHLIEIFDLCEVIVDSTGIQVYWRDVRLRY